MNLDEAIAYALEEHRKTNSNIKCRRILLRRTSLLSQIQTVAQAAG